MKDFLVVEEINKKEDTIIIDIEKIKNIKEDIDLDFNEILFKINLYLNKGEFARAKEYVTLGKSLIGNKNGKLNSLEAIMNGNEIIYNYENSIYNEYFIYKDINLYFDDLSRLDEIESSDDYKKVYFKLRNIRDEICNSNVLKNLEEEYLDFKNNPSDAIYLFTRNIFKNKFERNFYSSIEFINNIIENNIYTNFESLDEFIDNVIKVGLLYELNNEESKENKLFIMKKLDIIEIYIINYIYQNYLMDYISDKRYYNLEHLKKDMSDIYKRISSFNSNVMPL